MPDRGDVLSGSQEHRAGSGDGWTQCAAGHRHWGRFGAAGLLLASQGLILLQLRSAGTHHGGTWSVPGGARDAHEDAVTAALREASEEVGIRADAVRVGGTDVDDHGGWSYTTVLARPRGLLTFRPDHETEAVRWVAVDEVGDLALHPGFRSSWPRLHDRLAAQATRPMTHDTASASPRTTHERVVLS